MPRRQPHRFIPKAHPGVVLSFWTAQAAGIARNACIAEHEGRSEDASNYWALARDLSPADAATRRFCDERARPA
jgi:hypothetical protein